MTRSYFSVAAVILTVTAGACKGGSDGGGSTSSPTAPSASATCSPPVVTTCTNPEAPNDSRTAIGQITVAAGGAPSCRVAVREAIPISFTIVRPDSNVTWQIVTNTRQSASPSSGSAGSAGPFQATVQFTTFGGDNRTDDKFRITTSNGLGCDVPIHGRK